MTEEILNLLDLPTRVMAEAGTSPPQVMGSDTGQTTL